MKTAVINTHSPFATEHGREALDLAMVLATYEQNVALFFKGAGVLQLRVHQKDHLDKKDFTATFKALDLYDVDDVFVLASDLEAYGVDSKNLPFDITVLEQTEFHQQLALCQRKWSF